MQAVNKYFRDRRVVTDFGCKSGVLTMTYTRPQHAQA